jgi:hypothetical protein
MIHLTAHCGRHDLGESVVSALHPSAAVRSCLDLDQPMQRDVRHFAACRRQPSYRICRRSDVPATMVAWLTCGSLGWMSGTTTASSPTLGSGCTCTEARSHRPTAGPTRTSRTSPLHRRRGQGQRLLHRPLRCRDRPDLRRPGAIGAVAPPPVPPSGVASPATEAAVRDATPTCASGDARRACLPQR